LESVVLDSSVVIAFLNPEDRHHKAARRAIAGAKARFKISTITFTESMVLAARQSDAVANEFLADLENYVGPFVVLDSEIAMAAAKLRAKTGLAIPDAIISASATATGAILWTFDKSLAKAHSGAVLIGS
jgi:predicted nucleic acid-binding protein